MLKANSRPTVHSTSADVAKNCIFSVRHKAVPPLGGAWRLRLQNPPLSHTQISARLTGDICTLI